MAKAPAAVLLCSLVAGCAGNGGAPSAQALRQGLPGAEKKSEVFEVRRRHRDVAASLQKHAKLCLETSVKGIAWQTTLVVSAQKAELHLERRAGTGASRYVLVLDAYPARGGRSRVELFAAPAGLDGVIRAVRGWAAGENLPCPDLANTG